MTKTNEKKFKTLDLAYLGMSVALIAVCSWISFPLAIPITLQTLAICLVSGLFGAKRGVIATLAYLIIGAIGLPVYAQFTSGIGVLFGPSGGYFIGFLFTALITGIAVEKCDGKFWKTALFMALGVLVCYAFGTAWFAFVYAKKNQPASLMNILGWCVFPFIPFDAAKVIVAAILTNRLRRFVK